MSWFSGNEDEMGIKDQGLSIHEAELLLDGNTPDGRDDLAMLATDLVSLAGAFRRDVDPVDIARWAAQAATHTPLVPSDKGDLAATSASNAHGPALQAAGLPKRRTPMISSLAAFLATALGRTVAAGALIAATTAGVAATGNLPGQSDELDRVIATADDREANSAEDEGGELDGATDACQGLEGADQQACEDEATDADDDARSGDDDCDDADEVDEVDEVDDADEVGEVDEVGDADDDCDAVDEVGDADDADNSAHDSGDVDEVDEVDEADDHEVDEADDHEDTEDEISSDAG